MSENKVLSREDILAMEPGRELDSVVMKTIFNASENYYGEGELWFHYDSNGEPDYEWSCYFSPSTDISAAWEVVEKMKRNSWSINVTSWGDDEAMGEDPYLVTFGVLGGPNNFMSFILPEAICKAALLAVME